MLYRSSKSGNPRSTKAIPFIERFGLWTAEQKRRAAEIKRRVEKDKLRLIRVVWSDTHGHARTKELTVPAFLSALSNGYNINVATTTLDASGARTFSSFTPGGGMGLEEMTGSPNLTIVPDPATFRVLPWAPGVGWILCDEYFNTGIPFHFSPRQLLRRQIGRLTEQKKGLVVGLEVEWYLLRVADDCLGAENIGIPGTRGKPIRTIPAEPGYSYHSESNFDLMQPVLSQLAEHFETIDLPLRSIENEWGPGQVECTFAPRSALEAADNLILFRSATRQICRRMAYFATFMARPAIKGYYSSGWHLHQSLVDASGKNLFMPPKKGDPLSQLGLQYLGGLLAHAQGATPFTTPTINGYRRFRPNSLAPDRATWAYDHRGVMLRVLGAPGDGATRIENRAGEPSANPYLYMAAQIVAGLDGVANKRDPGPQELNPYASQYPLLPNNLEDALKALEVSDIFRAQFGEVFMDYFLRLKRNELGRYARWREDHGRQAPADEPSDWEQNEYFDFF
ncbi:MAG: glutamine synthetase family protein [Pseudorhodoplanes sp.]|jgi:glutamine synthetase|nr:glutamine synthetase family protein [Pseudorhodoplanes sp.]